MVRTLTFELKAWSMTIKKKGKHSKKRKKNWASKIFKILRKALVMKSFDLNKFSRTPIAL